MPAITLSSAQLERILQACPNPTEDELSPVEFSYMRAQLFSHSAEMKALFTERFCQPGEVLFEENDPGSYIYIIISGQVAIVKGGWDAPIILGCRGAWQVIGEMALLDKGPRSASVVAIRPTRLLYSDWEGFRTLLGEQNFVGYSLLETLSQRLRQSDEDRRSTRIAGQELSDQISQLETDNRLLNELSRLRQETADLIVHDLRNPLGAIFMALRTLEFSLPEDEIAYNRELLDAAISSCTRMQRLVDSMLEVARIEFGNAVLVLSQFDLRQLIADLAHNTRALNQGRVELVTDLPSSLPAVIADRDKIERLLANLLDNAIKYTPTGGQVALAVSIDPGDMLRISITNSGPGIPPAERQRIFERFNQVPGEQARRRGFGLGLTYCKLTVEAHHGQIWVEDGPNNSGSRFIFTLPLKQ